MDLAPDANLTGVFLSPWVSGTEHVLSDEVVVHAGSVTHLRTYDVHVHLH